MDIQNLTGNSIPSETAASNARAEPSVANVRAAPPAVKQAQQAVAQKTDPASLQNAVDNINKSLQQSNTAVEFSIDKDTKKSVVKMLDSSTGEVIRQYPSEVTLAISKAIDQQLTRGVLLNQKA